MSSAGATPSLAPLLARLLGSTEFAALETSLRRDGAAALIHVPHAAKGELVAALARRRRIAWIARDPEVAERVAATMRSWFDDPSAVLLLEPRTALPFERGELVVDESAGRVATLAAWGEAAGVQVIVTSVLAALQPTIAKGDVAGSVVTLRPGERIALDEVARRALALGYAAVPLVGLRGEIARRGGIVDIFPAGATLPLRIEWLGDEIESIRAIDPSTQRSGEDRALVRLLPASEFQLDAARVAAARAAAERLVGSDGDRLPSRLAEDLDRWESSLTVAASGTAEPGDGVELWAPIIAPSRALDEIGEALVVLDEPAELLQVAASLARQAEERRDALRTTRLLPKDWPSPLPGGDAVASLLAAAGSARIELTDRKSTRLNSSH